MIGVRSDGDDYVLLIETNVRGRISYSELSFDGTSGRADRRAESVSEADLVALETRYGADLDGDGNIGLAAAATEVVRNAADDVALVEVAGAYGIDADLGDDTNAPVILTDSRGRSEWAPGAYDSVIGVRQEGTDVLVLVETDVRGRISYSEHRFDATTGQEQGRAVAVDAAALPGLEAVYDADLNGDEETGYVSSGEAIATAQGDDAALYAAGGGAFAVFDAAGTGQPDLLYTSRGDFWAPSVGETVAGLRVDGGDIYLMLERDGAFSEQRFTPGNSLVETGAPVRLEGDALAQAEVLYDVDFDGDTITGTEIVARLDNAADPSIVEGQREAGADNGDVSLFEMTSGAFVVADADAEVGPGTPRDGLTADVTLTRRGETWTPADGEAIAVRELEGGGFGVIVRAGPDNAPRWSEQLFDAEGDARGYADSLTFRELVQLERAYDQDFDDNGYVTDVVRGKIDLPVALRTDDAERALYASTGDGFFVSEDDDKEGGSGAGASPAAAAYAALVPLLEANPAFSEALSTDYAETFFLLEAFAIDLSFPSLTEATDGAEKFAESLVYFTMLYGTGELPSRVDAVNALVTAVVEEGVATAEDLAPFVAALEAAFSVEFEGRNLWTDPFDFSEDPEQGLSELIAEATFLSEETPATLADFLFDADAGTELLESGFNGRPWEPSGASTLDPTNGNSPLAVRSLDTGGFAVLVARTDEGFETRYSEQSFDANGTSVGRLAVLTVDQAEGLYLTDLNADDLVNAFGNSFARQIDEITLDGHTLAIHRPALIDLEAYGTGAILVDKGADEYAAIEPDYLAPGVVLVESTLLDQDSIVLSERSDDISGTSRGDTVVGFVVEDFAMYSSGDRIDMGSGYDTLEIVNHTDRLELSEASISNVEEFQYTNAYEDPNNEISYIGDDFDADLGNIAFEKVTIDFGGDHYKPGAVEFDEINAKSAVFLENLGDFEDDVTLNFATSSDVSGKTDVTIADADFNELYLEINASFTSAEDYQYNFTMDKVEADDNFEIYSNVYLEGTVQSLEANLKFTDLVDDDDDIEFDYNFYMDGIETTLINIDIFDSEISDVDVYYKTLDGDYFGNGVNDTANIRLKDMDTNGDFAVRGMENINLIIEGDVEIGDDLEFYYYSSEQTLNIEANGNLFVNGDLNMNGNAYDQLIKITGSGDVDLGDVDMYDDEDVDQIIDASLATGNITVEDTNSAIDLFKGGFGDDVLLLDWDGTVADMGEGDDFVDTSGYDYGAFDAGSLDGGEGSDTIAINDAIDFDAETAANITNFEVLNIGDGTGVYDMSLEVSLNSVQISNDEVAAGETSVINAAAGTSLNFVHHNDGNNIEMADLSDASFSFSLADDSAVDDSLEIGMLAVDNDDDQDAEFQIDAGLTANGIEQIVISSNAEFTTYGTGDARLTSADYENVFWLEGDSVEEITIGGNARLDLVVGAWAEGADKVSGMVSLVDASGNTAGVSVDMAMFHGLGDAANSVAVLFKGSNKDDTYYASTNADTIEGNGGADRIYLEEEDVGVGETVVLTEASNSQVVFVDRDSDGDADSFTGIDEVAYFRSAEDTIEFTADVGLAAGSARAELLQIGTLTITEDLADVFEGFGTDFFNDAGTDRAVAFGTDGTDGYVFVDANGDGDFNSVNDMVIEMIGVTALAIGDFSFG